MKCEVCGSDHVSRVSLVYEGGLSGATSTHTMVGASRGGGLGGGLGKTSTVSQSALSARLAPPARKRLRGGIVLAIIAVVWLFIAIAASNAFVWAVFVVLLGLAVLLLWRAAKYNGTTWRELRTNWESAFICMACNHTFVA